MTAVSSPIRIFLAALTLSVLASPAGAATRALVSGTLSDPQISGDTPAFVTCSTPAAHAHGPHVAAAAATTHTAVHAKGAHHRRHLVKRAHEHVATLRSASHHAGAPLPAHPVRSTPAHRAPAPATPRYDGGKTAQNRYRSLQGAAAFSPPAALTRTETAVLLAVHSELFVPRTLRVEEGRGPPRAGPSSNLAATVPFRFRSAAPHRTASPPVPSAPADSRRILARPSRAFAFSADSEPLRALRAQPLVEFSPLRSVDPRPLALLTRVGNHPGVRRPEGTAPHHPQPPSILGGLT